jgi:hypothetical protein
MQQLSNIKKNISFLYKIWYNILRSERQTLTLCFFIGELLTPVFGNAEAV